MNIKIHRCRCFYRFTKSDSFIVKSCYILSLSCGAITSRKVWLSWVTAHDCSVLFRSDQIVIFLFPVHTLMSSTHGAHGLPLPLSPFSIPLIFPIEFLPIMICPNLIAFIVKICYIILTIFVLTL